MTRHLAYSSEIYPLKVSDLLLLGDSPAEQTFSADAAVTVLIGDAAKGTPDTLLCGRRTLELALNSGQNYVPTRIAYRTISPWLSLWINMIKPLKRRYYVVGTGSYHLPLDAVFAGRLARGVRNADNAYGWSNKKWAIPAEERRRRYNELYTSLQQHGYDDKSPMMILLNRAWGVKDQLLQGHHRLSICKELNISEVAVNFWSAPQSPRFIRFFHKIYERLKGY